MTKEDFESLRRGLAQAHAHLRGEDVGCVVHRASLRKLWNETTNEGVPDWAAQLLAKMK